MRKEHICKAPRLAILLFAFLISSFNIYAQNIPEELSFIIPEMSFPSINVMGFLKLPYVGFDYGNYTWYHANGEKANYGDTWYHANGDKANY